MSLRSDVLDAMITAAQSAGEGLRAAYARPSTVRVREKGASDFVSSADLNAQEMVRSVLARSYPQHGFLFEEEPDHAGSSGPRFIVDPLDGTTNFLHQIPHFAVSIALEVDGEIVSGTVVDPMKGEIFWAERGRGAWLGERRLRVSGEATLARSVVSTGIPHHGGRDHASYLRALSRIMGDVAGIRRMGAAALDLAYVAAGRVEAFFERGLAPWDVAAGTLLVSEAGGLVTQTDGTTAYLSGDVLAASNSELHAILVKKLEPLHQAAVDA
jgi:myo-inositol-1(or 4)-monophosphatase